MKMIFIFICLLAFQHNIAASDFVIWQKEINIDSNSSFLPAALMGDRKNNEVIVLGMPAESGPPKTGFCQSITS